MYELEVELKNEAGLHARPANLFVKKASKFSSDIKVIKDGKEYIAKSIMGILSMGAGKGTKIKIVAQGEDEKQAVESLKELVDGNFGE
ncbi:HPr family phosphocarrier protein [Maledivibacter halophilus]|uniref:Phosphocarrier protein HPr n=1 Tax=Maledivibacter halophilus TaxID=36842 RepID=A0A1T5MJF8_9FIRM|nr:HPr family phosphocarrier protein [Maledivibacter halophilus]SKC88064.1 phosphocarrier protein [Maledivibacter halophilus]